MAVSIPSDLIADVMRVADPARLRAASRKLGGTAPADPAAATGFSTTLDSLSGPARAEAAYRSFEQMMLRNVFESILPKADSGIYGDGTSSGIWRSMTADQLAAVYAKSSGIGIAQSLTPGQPVMVRDQWPYFAAPEIRGFAG